MFKESRSRYPVVSRNSAPTLTPSFRAAMRAPVERPPRNRLELAAEGESSAPKAAAVKMKQKALTIALIAFLGMVDALDLSVKRGSGSIPCHVTEGCNEVITSRYSELAGIPISWFGFAFYLAVFSSAVFALFGTLQP